MHEEGSERFWFTSILSAHTEDSISTMNNSLFAIAPTQLCASTRIPNETDTKERNCWIMVTFPSHILCGERYRHYEYCTKPTAHSSYSPAGDRTVSERNVMKAGFDKLQCRI